MTSRAFQFGLIQALFLAQGGVEAGRSKLSCYEDYPMSCSEDKVSFYEIDFDVEEACHRIEEEVLRGQPEIIKFPEVHPDYLNGIEATHEFCPLMQKAYSHCAFCGGPRFYELCQYTAHQTRCGERPTRQELIQEGVYQNEEDIDIVCSILQQTNNRTQIPALDYPRSFDMCVNQEIVKHVCPGECTNGCFETPPTCDADPSAEMDEEEAELVCTWLRQIAFDGVENRAIFNESTRLDYLRVVPADHPNCDAFRRAYPHCFWCSGVDSLCYQPPDNLPTCEKPKHFQRSEANLTLVNEVCQDLFFNNLFFIEHPQDFFNVTNHGKFLGMMENTTQCSNAQDMYHMCPWCGAPELECKYTHPCHLKNATAPDEQTQNVMEFFNISYQNHEACDSEEVQLFFFGALGGFTTQDCYMAAALARLCPEAICPQPEPPQEISPNYLGADSEADKKALIWMSRTSAILSFCGASYILYDILSNPQSRRTVYHQLLVGMAIFDITTALTWAFATAPINKNDPGATHVWGVIGTEATCKAQGFFIQLGFSSVFYNVSLALYYVLVIAHGWKEFQLRKVRVYMHLFPLTLGIGLAFGGLVVYHWIEYGCHIFPAADDEGELWHVLVFVIVPLGLSILAITLAMGIVYNSVRKQSAASRKWSFGIGGASKLEKAVFWQCFFYVLAFYITWPIMFSVYLFSIDEKGPLGLAMAIAFVAPLQGFNNFLVYTRPKIVQHGRAGSDNMQNLLSKVFTALFLKTPSQTESAGSHDEEDPFCRMDPSVVVAMSESEKITLKASLVSRLSQPAVGVESGLATNLHDGVVDEGTPNQAKEMAPESKGGKPGRQLEPVREEDSLASSNREIQEEAHASSNNQSSTEARQTVDEFESLREEWMKLNPHVAESDDDYSDSNSNDTSDQQLLVADNPSWEESDENSNHQDGSLLYPRHTAEGKRDWSQYLFQKSTV